MLQDEWKYLRLYDYDQHAATVLQVIHKEQLNLKVMLGAYIVAEVNNFGCPLGGTYSEAQLIENKAKNIAQIKKLIQWANKYPN